MTEEECSEVYRQLADMLRKAGVGWIVEHVDGEIHLGKPEAKELVKSRRRASGTGSEYALIDARDKTSTKVFQQTVAYTQQERLRMLISGIRNTVISAIDIEERTLASLGDGNQLRYLRFAPEDDAAGEYTLEASDIDTLVPSKDALSSLLDLLEREI